MRCFRCSDERGLVEFEAFGADEDGVGLGKAVGLALGVKEFVDG
jgi:hypothetical protein